MLNTTRWIALAAAGVALAGCGGSGSASGGIATSDNDQVAAVAPDSPFGAREPRTCPPRNFPGPPTSRQALNLFVCDAEKDLGGYRYLVSNVGVQVGASRPFEEASDSGASDIDVSALVYPIEGHMISYQCNRRDAMLGQDPNKNCLQSNVAHSTGTCYKSTFGEWHCMMMGGAVLSPGYQPPPTGG
jgi:hypothetical protein